MAQHIVTELENLGITYQGIIINLGGDLCTSGVDEAGNTFIFEIHNPITNHTIPLPLRDSCLATSGTYKRTWTLNNKPQHHLLNGSGASSPATNIVSASVACESGSLAEGYAKVLLSKPLTEALDIIHKPNINYILIDHNGTVTTS